MFEVDLTDKSKMKKGLTSSNRVLLKADFSMSSIFIASAGCILSFTKAAVAAVPPPAFAS